MAGAGAPPSASTVAAVDRLGPLITVAGVTVLDVAVGAPPLPHRFADEMELCRRCAAETLPGERANDGWWGSGAGVLSGWAAGVSLVRRGRRRMGVGSKIRVP
jgi:hypothetical protein